MSSVLIFLAVLLFVSCILQFALPGFERQRRAAQMARSLNLTQAEELRRGQNPFVRRFSELISRGKWLDSILGASRREIYNRLGFEKKYEVYIAQVLVNALMMAGLPLAAGLLLEENIFLLLTPAVFFLFGWYGLRQITVWYNKRQNELIEDLPNLISKMITALEVGKPLTVIFEEVSERCSPLLAEMLRRLIADTNIMPIKDALLGFADTINIDVIHDFVSVINVMLDKGFREAEDDLQAIQKDLSRLSKLSLELRTQGDPKKMNIFNILMIGHTLIFIGLMGMKLFGALSQL
ncbi:type II secretion system F family protein [Paenibacillus solani]|uniref:type II secretion system F family protein n=1 Tax=Paenibacillus solani TaxID=1705565 RepID=UPI003D267726